MLLWPEACTMAAGLLSPRSLTWRKQRNIYFLNIQDNMIALGTVV